MILCFDLDDTLYPEDDYRRSGFRAVAGWAASRYHADPEFALATMERSVSRHGRGRAFDDLLRGLGVSPSRSAVRELIRVYRHHEPAIALPRSTVRVLDHFSSRRLFLVTDGHKVVQAKKLDALGLWPRFEHAYLTNRYGVAYQKPSPRVFELMLARTNARPQDVVYVGDNPNKDFLGIRPLGFRTIRVRTGMYRNVRMPPAYDAESSVASLPGIIRVLRKWEAV